MTNTLQDKSFMMMIFDR